MPKGMKKTGNGSGKYAGNIKGPSSGGKSGGSGKNGKMMKTSEFSKRSGSMIRGAKQRG